MAAAALGLLAAPAAALAAGTVQFMDFGNGTSQVTFTAGPGDENQVLVSGSATEVTITDVVVIAIDGASSPGCTGGGTVTVVCTGSGIALNATLDNLNDRLESTATVPSTVRGGVGADTLLGGPGPDFLDGEGNVDNIAGRGGDDFVVGGGGDLAGDLVSGGPGDDSFRLATSDGADALDGGDGIDDLTATSPFLLAGFSYTLGDATANDGFVAQGANLTGIEDIDTGEGVDLVRGTAGPNVITTFDGDDVVDGLDGADFIALGSQDDTVQARDGYSDRIGCSSGTDTATVDQLDVLSDCEHVTRTFVEPAGTFHPLPPPPAPPPPAPPPPPPTPSADTKAPVCRVSVAGTIREPRRAIRVTESCDEPVSLRVTLSAPLAALVVAARVGDVRMLDRSFPNRTAWRRFSLRIPRGFRAALGRRATLRLGVAATDAAGNSSSQTKTIRLRRR